MFSLILLSVKLMEAGGQGLILQFSHVTENIMILPHCISYFSNI